jgi:hypothetical protein
VVLEHLLVEVCLMDMPLGTGVRGQEPQFSYVLYKCLKPFDAMSQFSLRALEVPSQEAEMS